MSSGDPNHYHTIMNKVTHVEDCSGHVQRKEVLKATAIPFLVTGK
jgi:hypothetical protein